MRLFALEAVFFLMIELRFLEASRARMVALKSMHKIRGQASQTLYPQPEGQLGECMIKYGRELGSDNLFG